MERRSPRGNKGNSTFQRFVLIEDRNQKIECSPYSWEDFLFRLSSPVALRPERSKPQGGSPDLKPARSRQAALKSDQLVWRSAGLRVDKRERFTAWLSNGLEVVSQLVLGGDAGVRVPIHFGSRDGPRNSLCARLTCSSSLGAIPKGR